MRREGGRTKETALPHLEMLMPPVPLLPESTLVKRLQALPLWQRQGAAIERQVKLPAFLDAIRLVTAVAERAEAADHHPDMDIRFNMVKFHLSTHDSGGLTELDLALAAEIDALVNRGA
jgi:4a-hydroxytetrahydrobiopterin dehydratase